MASNPTDLLTYNWSSGSAADASVFVVPFDADIVEFSVFDSAASPGATNLYKNGSAQSPAVSVQPAQNTLKSVKVTSGVVGTTQVFQKSQAGAAAANPTYVALSSVQQANSTGVGSMNSPQPYVTDQVNVGSVSKGDRLSLNGNAATTSAYVTLQRK